MTFYCTDEFKRAYERLLKKKSYQDLPRLFIKDILTQSQEHLHGLGQRLNQSGRYIFTKMRVGGRSG